MSKLNELSAKSEAEPNAQLNALGVRRAPPPKHQFRSSAEAVTWALSPSARVTEGVTAHLLFAQRDNATCTKFVPAFQRK